MKRIIITAMCICSTLGMVYANKSSFFTSFESVKPIKTKQFKITYTGNDLSSEANFQKFEEVYKQLIKFVELERETKSFKSVTFTTQIDSKNKEILVSDIKFHDENSFAVGLLRIFEVNNTGIKEIDIDGIAIEGTVAKEAEDIKQAEVLATAVVETIQSSEYSPSAKIVSSIDLNYQKIE